MSKARELAELGAVYDSGALSNRNLVINGGMQVAQRGTSTTGIGASSAFGSVDRFQCASSTTGRVTMAQDSVTDLAGFSKCIKLSCTTARTPTSGEIMLLRYAFEGHDLQRIGKGLAGAKETRLSFYVKASGAFTFAAELYDVDNARHISQLFTTTTGWNRIELTIPADVDDGSSPYDNDNAVGLLMQLWIHAGTSRTSGTLATSWANAVQANQAVGISNFLSSTSNEFYFTGMQYEVGTEVTPFEHRLFGDELERCQRYFYKETYSGSGPYATQYVASHRMVHLFHPTTMRAVPTSTTSYSGGTMSEYQSTARHFKAYISAQYDSTGQNYLQTSYQADAEL